MKYRLAFFMTVSALVFITSTYPGSILKKASGLLEWNKHPKPEKFWLFESDRWNHITHGSRRFQWRVENGNLLLKHLGNRNAKAIIALLESDYNEDERIYKKYYVEVFPGETKIWELHLGNRHWKLEHGIQISYYGEYDEKNSNPLTGLPKRTN